MKPTISIKKIKLKQKMGYELCSKELYHAHGLITHSETWSMISLLCIRALPHLLDIFKWAVEQVPILVSGGAIRSIIELSNVLITEISASPRRV